MYEEAADLPVVLFTYNRPQHTHEVLRALRLHGVRNLYIFSDGPKSETDREAVKATRRLFAPIDWTEPTVITLEQHIGLKDLTLKATDLIFQSETFLIFLDDECIPRQYFMRHMFECYERYTNDPEVLGISGDSATESQGEQRDDSSDVYYLPHIDGAVWGTWEKKWKQTDGKYVYPVKSQIKKLIFDYDLSHTTSLDKKQTSEPTHSNEAIIEDQGSPIRVLNIIQSIHLGGAARCMIAAAKYSQRYDRFQHTIASIEEVKQEYPYQYIEENELQVLRVHGIGALVKAMADYDVVVVHWWNCPELNELMKSNLPDTRLVIWAHVGGFHAPQIVTHELVTFPDFFIAGSPLTYSCPSIDALPDDIRLERTGMVYDPTDFERLQNFQPKSHQGFNVGYIGTVSFVKMHRNYVQMSAQVKIPEAKFIVCGKGEALPYLINEAKDLGLEEKFEIRGHVEEILTVLETMDVFGYPLCEDNYAAAELVLQEAMYVGIPPVVFPHGGVKYLVINDYTGLVVHSEVEYAEAIEYLYHHPEERKRLGENAKEYARQIFGAENAARAFNQYLNKVIGREKVPKRWGGDETQIIETQSGSEIFMQTLGPAAAPFRATIIEQDFSELLKADQEILQSTELMRLGGIAAYKGRYPDDPMLHFWYGLASLGTQKYHEAIESLSKAVQIGFTDWRVGWYLGVASKAAGHDDIAEQLFGQLSAIDPILQQKIHNMYAEIQASANM